MILLVVTVLFAGYTTYCSTQTNSQLAVLSLMNIESLAGEDDMDNGESIGIRNGAIDNPKDCIIKETYECKVGFTIPDWVPYVGGMSCGFTYIDEVDVPGTRNDCIYTGNPTHFCDYYRCTRN